MNLANIEQWTMFKRDFCTAFELLQFCVTQGQMEQRAIAKKSSFLSQRETPPLLSKGTGQSWCCVNFLYHSLSKKKCRNYSKIIQDTNQLANSIRQGPQMWAVWVGEQHCINLANHLGAQEIKNIQMIWCKWSCCKGCTADSKFSCNSVLVWSRHDWPGQVNHCDDLGFLL